MDARSDEGQFVRTIAIVNQKGGCGKTTTAINLAAIYAKRGCRTLLVDMDPQAHCAAGLGVPEERIEYSIGEALTADLGRGFNPEDLRWEVTRNLDLAPSTMRLATLEAPGGGLHSLPDKDRRLEALLRRLRGLYDVCLIDCSPTIGLLTFNALRAARETLIPVETGYFSLKGAEKQWTTIQRMIAHIGRPIACHMIATLYDPESSVATNILSTLRRRFAGQLLPVVVRFSETIREATCLGQPVIDYAPTSSACEDFVALADWLESHASPTGDGMMSSVESISASSLPIDVGRMGVSPTRGTSPASAGPARGTDRAAELVERVQRLSRNANQRGDRTPEPMPDAVPFAVGTAVIAETKPLGLQTSTSTPPRVVEIAVAPLRSCPVFRMTPVNRVLPAAKATPVTESVAKANPQSVSTEATDFGVQCSGRSVVFVQPADSGRCVAVAGDFNGWSPTTTVLHRCEESGHFRATVDMLPGRYQYRLVVDGCWQADRYNMRRSINRYGEPNSLLEVREPV